jgi:hypothetical protein
MTDAGPGDGHDAALIEAALQHYHARRWSAALMLFRAIHQRSPELAVQRGIPLALGHCLIELNDDADPGALARELVQQPPYTARVERAFWMRVRAIELCRAREFARARRLLKFLASYDMSIGMVYYESFIKGRTGCWETALAGQSEPPGFLEAHHWSDAEVAAMRDKFRGLKMLCVMPLIYPLGPGDQFGRSAKTFGFTVEMLDRTEVLEGAAPGEITARLERAIEAFRPDVIFYNSFFELPLDEARHTTTFNESASAFAAARRRHGARVVACFRDAWAVAPERLVQGLGESVDVVFHCHPELLTHPALQDPRVYCFFQPIQIAAPTIAPGAIPRAGAIGSINNANAGRVVWWAEGAEAGLPLDFQETAFLGPDMRTPEDYANLLAGYRLTVNFSRRTSGAKIITARTLETLAVGGVLVEEDSANTRYFLQPGRHYVPFETWADLAELIPWMLDRPDLCRRLAQEGKAWVERYFLGDWFWVGLLDRLYPARP